MFDKARAKAKTASKPRSFAGAVSRAGVSGVDATAATAAADRTARRIRFFSGFDASVAFGGATTAGGALGRAGPTAGTIGVA